MQIHDAAIPVLELISLNNSWHNLVRNIFQEAHKRIYPQPSEHDCTLGHLWTAERRKYLAQLALGLVIMLFILLSEYINNYNIKFMQYQQIYSIVDLVKIICTVDTFFFIKR
ncbi:hypothetical protein ACJX0J_027240 [Zea mays]